MNAVVHSSLAADFPKIVVDETAESVSELLDQWPKGRSALMKFIASKLQANEWEMVHKHHGSKLVPAYRRI